MDEQRWLEDLGKQYDAIIAVVESALQAKRKIRITDPCTKCECKHIRYVEVEDVDAAIKAAEFLSNRAQGRPGQARVEDDRERVVFERVVYMSPDADPPV